MKMNINGIIIIRPISRSTPAPTSGSRNGTRKTSTGNIKTLKIKAVYISTAGNRSQAKRILPTSYQDLNKFLFLQNKKASIIVSTNHKLHQLIGTVKAMMNQPSKSLGACLGIIEKPSI